MINFLFAWMGSFMFWVVYALISLVVGTLLLRKFGGDYYKFCVDGEYREDIRRTYYFEGEDYFFLFLILVAFYILWPISGFIVLFYYSLKVSIIYFLALPFSKVIEIVDKILPDIEIKKK